MGARTRTGDLILETAEWREKLFRMRAPDPRLPWSARVVNTVQAYMPGMFGGGGGMALNQLLIQMDGVDEPPFFRKVFTKRFNTFLDATYLVPQRLGRMRLRIRPPKPRPEQIYFIGATNVPIDALDPALIRPGRMGRHIWFRTPTKDDRQDIFELYLGKVDHEADLDTPERRDELSRMTNGYSPAMIEQVCSMALTYAHSDGRHAFDRADIVEAMTTIESGTAVGVATSRRSARGRHPRGRPRGREPRVHEGRHVHPPLHPHASRLLGPPPGHREGGAILVLAPRGSRQHRLDARRDGRRARLLRGELRRRGGRHPERDLAGRADGRHERHGPRPPSLEPDDFPDDASLHEAERQIMDRFERIGLQIMNRGEREQMEGDPIGSVLSDPAKRRAAAQILGQAYLTAVCCMRHNREAVAAVADALVRRREPATR